MNNYQLLQQNLHDLKLTQMSLKIDDYITQVNEGKISVVDALFELTTKELEVKNFNATNAMVITGGTYTQDVSKWLAPNYGLAYAAALFAQVCFDYLNK